MGAAVSGDSNNLLGRKLRDINTKKFCNFQAKKRKRAPLRPHFAFHAHFFLIKMRETLEPDPLRQVSLMSFTLVFGGSILARPFLRVGRGLLHRLRSSEEGRLQEQDDRDRCNKDGDQFEHIVSLRLMTNGSQVSPPFSTSKETIAHMASLTWPTAAAC